MALGKAVISGSRNLPVAISCVAWTIPWQSFSVKNLHNQTKLTFPSGQA